MSRNAVARFASRLALVLCAALGAAGCIEKSNLMEPSADSLSMATTVCVDQVNQLRASVGDPPLAQSDRLKAFSRDAARIDGEAHQAHKYFFATNGGNGAASAENMIPWWKVSAYGSVQAVVREGLSMMWAEGANGEHYAIMRGRYTEMGCGIAVINGEVTVSQDFR